MTHDRSPSTSEQPGPGDVEAARGVGEELGWWVFRTAAEKLASIGEWEFAAFLEGAGGRLRAAEEEVERLRNMNARLYVFHLSHDPKFPELCRKAKEMFESDDNADRIPADRFIEWAEGLRDTAGQGTKRE